MDPEIVAALIGPVLTAAPPPGSPGIPPRPDQFYPGPVPSPPGEVSAGYPLPG